MGESGSGKTTLLNILAALDKPTAGTVVLNGKNLAAVREKEMSAFRREHLGFVFQDFNLLDNFSLKDNIFLPLVLFIKDGEVFHQLYRGNMSNEQLYAKISDTLTVLTTGGEQHE